MEIQNSVVTKDEKKDWIGLLNSAEPNFLEVEQKYLGVSWVMGSATLLMISNFEELFGVKDSLNGSKGFY